MSMVCDYIVRAYEHGDYAAVLPLIAGAHKASPVADYPLDEAEVKKLANDCADPEAKRVCGFVAYHKPSGEIVGILCGYVAPAVYTSVLVASDETLYVKPEHRKSRCAVMLIRAFEAWSREVGARCTTLGVMNGDKRVLAFYERLGYKCQSQRLTMREL